MKFFRTCCPTALALLLLAAVSCVGEKPDEEFLASGDISLTIDSRKIISWSDDGFQLAYSEEKAAFAVMSDGLEQYFILSCSKLPTSEGQVLKASLDYTEGARVRHRSGDRYEVARLSDDGKVWLWCKTAGIAVCVKFL